MKILVVLGRIASTMPTDQISNKLVHSKAFCHDSITIINRSIGFSKKDIFLHESNLDIHTIKYNFNLESFALWKMKIPFFKKINLFFWHFVGGASRKILGIDVPLVRSFDKKSFELAKKNHFDCLLGIGGGFEYLLVARRLSRKFHIPFVAYFCDPFSFIKSKLGKFEKQIISSCDYCIVPSEYLLDYQKKYNDQKIVKEELPCLIDSSEILRIQNSLREEPHKKTIIKYFGSIGSFGRGLSGVCSAFGNSKNIDVWFFSDQSNEPTPKNFVFKQKINEKEMIKEMLTADFLLVLDNDNKMLPSKCVKYVSTTKPVIIFSNDTAVSSVASFFSDYPFSFFQRGNDFSDLFAFIKKESYPHRFNFEIYQHYQKFDPEQVFASIHQYVRKAAIGVTQ